ncbi:DUF5334 family protein [Salinicola sp. DM10]|uniref:DUF5334 family protein n=1 Tax=Salinicola sp. DM10 TaxID=2815721 RepID=UPI001A8D229E|nr:DUF5334 family protein [Salinicola sp. DM10]MCE3025760.1 DUF5334 domain-containing protein [Salinicola sp. DM10]
MKKLIIAAAAVAWAIAIPAMAWDGFDWKTASGVEIQQGHLVCGGKFIEIYDLRTGQYHDVKVERIESTIRGAEVEVYDYTTNTYRTFEMED